MSAVPVTAMIAQPSQAQAGPPPSMAPQPLPEGLAPEGPIEIDIPDGKLILVPVAPDEVGQQSHGDAYIRWTSVSPNPVLRFERVTFAGGFCAFGDQGQWYRFIVGGWFDTGWIGIWRGCFDVYLGTTAQPRAADYTFTFGVRNCGLHLTGGSWWFNWWFSWWTWNYETLCNEIFSSQGFRISALDPNIPVTLSIDKSGVSVGRSRSFSLSATNNGNGPADRTVIHLHGLCGWGVSDVSGGGSFDGCTVIWNFGTVPVGWTTSQSFRASPPFVRIDEQRFSLTAQSHWFNRWRETDNSREAGGSLLVRPAPNVVMDARLGATSVLGFEPITAIIDQDNRAFPNGHAFGVNSWVFYPSGFSAKESDSGAQIGNAYRWSDNIPAMEGRLHHATTLAPQVGGATDFGFTLRQEPYTDWVGDVFGGRDVGQTLRVFPGRTGTPGQDTSVLIPQFRLTQTLPRTDLRAGELLTVTLALANTGAGAADNVQISAVVPSDITVTSGGGSFRDASGNLVWSFPSIAAGGALSVSYTLQAPARPADTVYTLLGRATGTYTASNALQTIEASANGAILVRGLSTSFTLRNVASSRELASGGSTALTLTFTNTGQTLLNQVVLTEIVPSGFTVVSAPGATVGSGGLLTWPAVDGLQPGGSISKTLSVQAPLRREASDFAFVGGATFTDQFGRSFDAKAIETVKVLGTKGVLNFERSASKTSLSPRESQDGQFVTLTIALTNVGDSAVNDVVVSEAVPAGWTVTDRGTGSLSGSTLTFNVGSVAAGQKVTLSYKVSPPVRSQDTDFAFVATANYANVFGDAFTSNMIQTLKVEGFSVRLDVSKSLSLRTIDEKQVQAGAASVVTLVLTNSGTGDLSGIAVSDVVDDDLMVASIGQGGSLAGRTITWNPGKLAAGASTTLTYSVVGTVRKQDTDYVLASTINLNDPLGNQHHQSGLATLSVKGLTVSLTIVKQATRTLLEADERSLLTITLRNDGTAILRDLVASVPIHDQLLLTNAGGGSFAGGLLTFPAVPVLGAGASVKLSYEVQVPVRKQATTYNFEDRVLFTDPFKERHAGQGFTRIDVRPVPVLSLDIGKEAPPHKATKSVALSLGLTNMADRPVQGVVVQMPLPAGWEPRSITDFGAYDAARRVISWTLDLAGSQSFSTAVQLTAPYVQALTAFTFPVSADFPAAFRHGPATSSIALNLDPIPVLVLERGTTDREQRARQDVGFSLRVTNAGGAAAKEVRVTESIPGAWEALAGQISHGGAYDAQGYKVGWAFASIAPGESLELTYAATTPEIQQLEPYAYRFDTRIGYTDADKTPFDDTRGSTEVVAKPIPEVHSKLDLRRIDERPGIYSDRSQAFTSAAETRAGWGNGAVVMLRNGGWADAIVSARVSVPAGFKVYDTSPGARAVAAGTGTDVVFQARLAPHTEMPFGFKFGAPVIASLQSQGFEFPVEVRYLDPDGNEQPTLRSAGSVTVHPIPELAMARSLGEERVASGKRVHVALDVVNVGFDTAHDVRFADAVDAGLPIYAETLEASKPAIISLDAAANAARWTISTLAPGEHVRLSYVLRADAADEVQFRAMVAAGSYHDVWGGLLPGNVFRPLVEANGIAVRPQVVAAWSGVFGYDRLVLDLARPYLDAAMALKAEAEAQVEPVKSQLEAQAAVLRAAAIGLAELAKASAEASAAEGAAKAAAVRAEAEALIAQARADADHAVATSDATLLDALAKGAAAKDDALVALVAGGADAEAKLRAAGVALLGAGDAALAQAQATLGSAQGAAAAAAAEAAQAAQALRARAIGEVDYTVTNPEARVDQVQGIALKVAADLQALADELRATGEAKAQEAAAAAEAAKTAVVALAEGKATEVQATANALVAKAQALPDEARERAEALAAAAIALAEAAKEQALLRAAEAQAKALELAEELKARAEAAPGEIQAKAQETADQLKAAADHLVNYEVPALQAQIEDTATTLQAFAQATADKAIADASAKAAEIQAQAIEAAEMLRDRALALPDEARAEAEKAIANALLTAEAIKAFAEQTAAEAQEAARRTADAAQALATQLQAAALQKVDETQQQAIDAAEELQATAQRVVSEDVPALRASLEQTATDLQEFASMTAAEAIANAQATADKVQADAAQAAQDLQDAAERLPGEVQAAAEKAIADAQAAADAIRSMADRAAAQLQAEALRTVAAAQKLADEAVAAASRLPPEAMAKVDETIKAVDRSVGELGMAAVYALEEAVKAAQERLAEIDALSKSLPPALRKRADEAIAQTEAAVEAAMAQAVGTAEAAVAAAPDQIRALSRFGDGHADELRGTLFGAALPATLAQVDEVADLAAQRADLASAGALAGARAAVSIAALGADDVTDQVEAQALEQFSSLRTSAGRVSIVVNAARAQAAVTRAEVQAAAGVPLLSDAMDEDFAKAIYGLAGIRPVVLHTKAGVAAAAGERPAPAAPGMRASDVTGITPGGVDAVPMAIDALWLGNFGTDFEAHLEPFLGEAELQAVRGFVAGGGVLVASDVTLVDNPALQDVFGVAYEGYLLYARDSPAGVSIAAGTGDHPALTHRATEALAGSGAAASAHSAQLTLLDGERNLYSGFVAKVRPAGAEVLASFDENIDGLGARFTPAQVADQAATPAATLAGVAAARAAEAEALAGAARAQVFALPAEAVAAETLHALDDSFLEVSIEASAASDALDGLRVSLAASAAVAKGDAVAQLEGATALAGLQTAQAVADLRDARNAMIERALATPDEARTLILAKAGEVKAIADALPGQVDRAVQAAKADAEAKVADGLVTADETARAIQAAAAEEIAKASAQAQAVADQLKGEVEATPGRVTAAVEQAKADAEAAAQKLQDDAAKLKGGAEAAAARAVADALLAADQAQRDLQAAADAAKAAAEQAVADARERADEEAQRAVVAISDKVTEIQLRVADTALYLQYLANNPNVVIDPVVDLAMDAKQQAEATAAAAQEEALAQLQKAQDAAADAAAQAQALATALAEEVQKKPDEIQAELVKLQAEALATAEALQAFASAKAAELQATANEAVAKAEALKAELEETAAKLPDEVKSKAEQTVADLTRTVEETKAFAETKLAESVAQISAEVEAAKALAEAYQEQVTTEVAAKVAALSAAAEELMAAVDQKAKETVEAASAEVGRHAQEVIDEAAKVQQDPNAYLGMRLAEVEAAAREIQAKAEGEVMALATEVQATVQQIKAMAQEAGAANIRAADAAAAAGIATAGALPGEAGIAASAAAGQAVGTAQGAASAASASANEALANAKETARAAEEAQRALLAKVEELAFLALELRDAAVAAGDEAAAGAKAEALGTAEAAVTAATGLKATSEAKAAELAAQALAKAAEVRSILEAEVGARAVFLSERVLHPDSIAAGSPAVTVNAFGAGQAVLFTPALEGPWSTGQSAASWVLFARQASIAPAA